MSSGSPRSSCSSTSSSSSASPRSRRSCRTTRRGRGLGRGLLVLAALWWAWTGYAWLTNTLEPEEVMVRAGHVRGDGGDARRSLSPFRRRSTTTAVLFAVAYADRAPAPPPALRGRGQARPGPAASAVARGWCRRRRSRVALLVVGRLPRRPRAGGALGRRARGRLLRRSDRRGQGWRISPAHFAERHGLIVIIALGESIVAIGIGAAGVTLTAGVVAAAVLGTLVARRALVGVLRRLRGRRAASSLRAGGRRRARARP